jgi:hypothetical protein
MIAGTPRETRRPNIKHGELWTVVAEVSGEGVGLPRGTKIGVAVLDKDKDGNAIKVQLAPFSLNDWNVDPILSPLIPPETSAQDPGEWDPEWHWHGEVMRGDTNHRVLLGLIPGDPGILALHVNQNGIAVILR